MHRNVTTKSLLRDGILYASCGRQFSLKVAILNYFLHNLYCFTVSIMNVTTRGYVSTDFISMTGSSIVWCSSVVITLKIITLCWEASWFPTFKQPYSTDRMHVALFCLRPYK